MYFFIENVLGLLKDDMYYTHINAFVEEILLFPPKKKVVTLDSERKKRESRFLSQ